MNPIRFASLVIALLALCISGFSYWTTSRNWHYASVMVPFSVTRIGNGDPVTTCEVDGVRWQPPSGTCYRDEKPNDSGIHRLPFNEVQLHNMVVCWDERGWYSRRDLCP